MLALVLASFIACGTGSKKYIEEPTTIYCSAEAAEYVNFHKKSCIKGMKYFIGNFKNAKKDPEFSKYPEKLLGKIDDLREKAKENVMTWNTQAETPMKLLVAKMGLKKQVEMLVNCIHN